MVRGLYCYAQITKENKSRTTTVIRGRFQLIYKVVYVNVVVMKFTNTI